MHWLLLYDVVDDYLERRVPLRPAHLALVTEAHERGDLVMAGALADPADGAVLVFTGDGPSAAEEFAQRDPYVAGGLVTRWRVRRWNVVIGGTASASSGGSSGGSSASATSGSASSGGSSAASGGSGSGGGVTR